MSRIDNSAIPQETFISSGRRGEASRAAAGVVAAAAADLRRTGEKGPVRPAGALRRASSLVAAKSVEVQDFDGLAGRSTEDIYSDLGRILGVFERNADRHGEDEIDFLCRTMLSENMRRLGTYLVGRQKDGVE